MGLVELVLLALEFFPEGQQRAFVAAQKADLALKRQQSRLFVGSAAALAAGVRATPIPFADAALIVPFQVGRLAAITAAYGLSFSQVFLSTLAAATVGERRLP